MFDKSLFNKFYTMATDLSKRLDIKIEELVDVLYRDLELPQTTFKLRIDEGF